MPVLNDPTPQAGVAVTALTGGIADADGLAGRAVLVPLGRPGRLRLERVERSDARGSFTPGAAQVGKRLRVVVSFTDTNGTAESVTSAASAAVAPRAPGRRRAAVRPGHRARAGPRPWPCRSPEGAGGADPAGAGPRATSAPGRISGLAVDGGRVGPITVAANVPTGANVVRIRVFRLGRATPVGGPPAPAGASWRRCTAPPRRRSATASGSRSAKLRHLPPGRYRVEVRAGRSRTVLGPPSERTITVRAARGPAAG